MTRTEIINALAIKYNLKRYLEIGVADGANFRSIVCPDKISVDVDENTFPDYTMTSDMFFEYNKGTCYKFDLIFIDGLHTSYQVIRDVKNALDVLDDNGFIVMHDCNPPNKYIARETNDFDHQAPWTGDVWRAYLLLRQIPYLDMYVVDCDYGVGVISKSYMCLDTTITDPSRMSFEEFDRNRKAYLNLISESEFIKKHKLI